MKLSPLLLFVAFCLFASVAFARVGETEAELVKRYGKLIRRTDELVHDQGRRYKIGETLYFRSDDWTINALLINKRCEMIQYNKTGEWTEEQLRHLLELNGGRSQWKEQEGRNPHMHREWKRRDKTVAEWRHAVWGFVVKTPVVAQVTEAARKAAKEEASKLPKF